MLSEANNEDESCGILSFSETDYHSTVLLKRLSSADQDEDFDKVVKKDENDDNGQIIELWAKALQTERQLRA